MFIGILYSPVAFPYHIPMDSELENDIMKVDSFDELMLEMETKGVFVDEGKVIWRIMDMIMFPLGGYFPEGMTQVYQFMKIEDELRSKAIGLLSNSPESWKSIQVPVLVERLFFCLGRLSRDPVSNRMILDGIKLILDATERNSPGLLKTIKDPEGDNIVGIIFKKSGVFSAIGAVFSYGYCNLGKIVEGTLLESGMLGIVELLVTKFGFGVDTVVHGNTRLVELVGRDFFRKLGILLDRGED